MLVRRLVVSTQSLLILAVCFLTLRPVPSAAGGIPPASPEELTMKSEPLVPGAPAIILYRQVDRDDNGMTFHEDNFVRIKIFNEEGRKYANVEIPFVKQYNQVDKVKARTIRPDGSVVNFDGKVFEKSIVKARGVKYLAKTLTLSDVQPGCIIEYSYTYDFTEDALYDSHWILSEDLFTKHAVFSFKPYRGPYNIRWMWHDLPPGTASPTQGHDSVIRLDARNIPAFQTEDFMPPANEVKARVDFIYSDDPNDKEPETYWRGVGKRRFAELDHFIDKRGAMQQAVAQIVSPQDSPEEKLKKIYYRVQQMRNTSYEVSKTEQEEKREQNKKASNAEDIWKRGYGTGVQLTWLYLALVKAAGMDADGVWVSSRNNYFFNPKRESDSYRLNANIVLIRLNGKETYCDPGAKFNPYGLLPWYETGVAGLRLEKEGGTWIQTPLPPPSASTVQRTAKFSLTEEGDLEGTLTLTYTGLEAVRRRNEEHNEDDAGRTKFLEDAVRRVIPVVSEPTLTNKPEWNGSANPLVAEFTLKIPGWAAPTGRRLLLPVGVFSAQEKHLFDHTSRTHPIYMDFPFEQTDDITITVPTGWQVGTLPPAHKQDGHIVNYSMAMSTQNNSLRLNRTMTVDFMILEPKYYSALRTFFQGVNTGDDQQIVLQQGATSASR